MDNNDESGNSPEVVAFWAAYLATLPEADRPATFTAWSFGHTPAVADELGALVMAGRKTGTASLLQAYEVQHEPLPQVGDYSVILNGAGQPLCIIQTTHLEIRPFNAVTAEHAYAEGEDDRSLAAWREVHWRYFGRECAALGLECTETMPVLCERFRVVFRGAA